MTLSNQHRGQQPYWVSSDPTTTINVAGVETLPTSAAAYGLSPAPLFFFFISLITLALLGDTW